MQSGAKKFTAATVAAELKKIFDEERPNLPSTICSDNGTDFKNKVVSALLQEHKIKQLFIDTYSAQQNAFVERLNLTLKTLIQKYLSHYNGITITNENLQKLVANYNNTVHNTTHRTPASIHPGKVAKLLQAAKNEKFAREAIKARATILVEESLCDFPNLEIGNYVRVHRRVDGAWRKTTQLKAKAYMSQWFWTIYKVSHITRPKDAKAQLYTLFDLESKHDIQRKFLRQDLLKIDKEHLIRELNPGEYAVEKVLDSKKVKGKQQYLVRWSGYPSEYDSWVAPQASFQKAINEFK